MEPVYGTVIRLARLSWRIQGLKITVTGVDNLPTSGGAVVAINHTSYLDFTFAGLPAYQQGLGRKVRFMAKQEVFDHKITGPIMRSLRHIPVDRRDGSASYDAAVRMLKAGELVGVYPEATISRSFEIKEFKTGRPEWRSRPGCRSFRILFGVRSGSGLRTVPKSCFARRCRSRLSSVNGSNRRCPPLN